MFCDSLVFCESKKFCGFLYLFADSCNVVGDPIIKRGQVYVSLDWYKRSSLISTLSGLKCLNEIGACALFFLNGLLA
jgi:hypothetical protein